MNKQTLAEKLKLNIADAERKLRLAQKYPDLHEHQCRWKHVRLCTKEVNGKVTDATIKHNCGCCEDSPLEVWPYLVEDGIEVFSDPPCFVVGEKIPRTYRDMPYDGWEDKLREAGIAEVVIEKTKKRFPEND